MEIVGRYWGESVEKVKRECRDSGERVRIDLRDGEESGINKCKIKKSPIIDQGEP